MKKSNLKISQRFYLVSKLFSKMKTFYFPATLALLAFGCKKNSVDATAIPTNGLVAYYPLDVNAGDSSGNNNNGSIIGNVTIAYNRKGQQHSALSFGGIDAIGYIKIPTSPSMNLTNSLTVSLWYKLNSYRGENNTGYKDNNGFNVMIGKEGDRDGYYMGLSNDLTAGEQKILFGNYVSSGKKLSANGSPDGNSFDNLDKWMHLAMVIDGSGAKIFVNGKLVSQASGTPDFSSANNRNLYIGTMWANGTSWYPFNGLLDDVRIYNRVLSQNEITALYNE